ncbi:MAG: hypothetical protein ACKPKO_00315 [Candidatus Fonsibacter sp.]
MVPYYELPVYKTTSFQDLPCRPLWGQSDDHGAFNEPQTITLYSSSTQLTRIPDKIVVCVRKNIGGLTCSDTALRNNQKHIN